MEAPQDPHRLDSLKPNHGGQASPVGRTVGRTTGGGSAREVSQVEGREAGLESRKAPYLSESRDDTRIERAGALLASFARRTGIHAPGDAARRYLWTDAFAVQAMH